ncbi:MAG: putative sulfate/molybdate transporter [Desulfosarcinaceae bacterium]
MSEKYRFNRMELAGSLGDLGTILPLSIGMILVNGMQPLGIFAAVGLYYIGSGIYFGVTSPVEPMKVISAYAIATGIAAIQIQAATLLIGLLLLVLGASGLITVFGRLIPRPVVRGVQLSTGVLLISKGVAFMLGTSVFQKFHKAAEPYLSVQSIGPLPIGLVIGVGLGLLALLLLENRRLPAAIVVVAAGMAIGLLLGGGKMLSQLRPGFYLPQWLPFGLPSGEELSMALLVLVLPQIPMTLGNAVIANADLSLQYFPDNGKRVTYKALTISMGLANLVSFLIGGMAMCNGAGGLASRYRFGARSGGSNLFIGAVFLALAVFFGASCLALINLIPISALGVLLVFSGVQLSLTLLDMKSRKELFVPVLVVGITLAANLAAGFFAGIVIAYLLKWKKLNV